MVVDPGQLLVAGADEIRHEVTAIRVLATLRYYPASFAKRFVTDQHDMLLRRGQTWWTGHLTGRQRDCLWNLVWHHRVQVRAQGVVGEGLVSLSETKVKGAKE